MLVSKKETTQENASEKIRSLFWGHSIKDIRNAVASRYVGNTSYKSNMKKSEECVYYSETSIPGEDRGKRIINIDVNAPYANMPLFMSMDIDASKINSYGFCDAGIYEDAMYSLRFPTVDRNEFLDNLGGVAGTPFDMAFTSSKNASDYVFIYTCPHDWILHLLFYDRNACFISNTAKFAISFNDEYGRSSKTFVGIAKSDGESNLMYQSDLDYVVRVGANADHETAFDCPEIFKVIHVFKSIQNATATVVDGKSNVVRPSK